MKPTPDQATGARISLMGLLTIHGDILGPHFADNLRVLLAATEPPTETSAPEALVEELRLVGWDAVDGAKVLIEGDTFGIGWDALPTFIRAVLSHLARRGVEGLPSDVEETERLSAEATPGPWGERCGTLKHYAFSLDEGEDFGVSLQEMHWQDGREIPAHANAVFIARSRTLVPALAAEVKQGRALLAARDAVLAEARAEIERLEERAHAVEQTLDDRNALIEEIRAHAAEDQKRLAALHGSALEERNARVEAQRNEAALREEIAGLRTEFDARTAFAEKHYARAEAAEKRLAAVMALPAEWRQMVQMLRANFDWREGVRRAADWLENELRRAPSGTEAPHRNDDMTLDLSNPGHREALRWAVEMYVDDMARVRAWLDNAPHGECGIRTGCIRALSSPAESAAIVRALLEGRGVDVSIADHAHEYRIVPSEDGLWIRGGSERLRKVPIGDGPALILRLLSVTTREEALAALREAVR